MQELQKIVKHYYKLIKIFNNNNKQIDTENCNVN